LHAAVRAILPLLPALAASSPFVEGRHPGSLDCRLGFYATNARRIPSVTGQVVPEAVFGRAAYEALLGRIYADLAPLDPQGVLRHEWLNARGAIARFDRMALELRVLDVQEHPGADLAIAAAATAAIRGLSDPAPAHQQRLRALDTAALAATLAATARAADAAQIEDRELLRALGLDASPRRAGRVWAELIGRHLAPEAAAAEHRPALERILDEGCLARRILGRAGLEPSRPALRAVYAELCECLRAGRSFAAAP
jgi:gamma-glutamyl:cysteine ligase YbdK (ATP-grasp superfamily)